MKLLHIFTQQGRTYTFHNITQLVTNESVISFNYEAMSDGNIKHATFYVASIAGWSKAE